MWMISMKAVLDIVSQYCPDDDGSCSKAGVDLREMLDEIEGLDETEVEPVKHGKWIIDYAEGTKIYHAHCSECGEKPDRHIGGDYYIDKLSDFCPNCGARMDGDSDD